MPKGNAPFQKPQKVAKKDIPTQLIKYQSNEWVITDGWEMTDNKTVIESRKSVFDSHLNTETWYNATVPGTVLTTLVNQGVFPNPFYGLNNLAIPDSLSRMDWWYRCKFTLPKEAEGQRIRLLFNGINYRADVYLNGKSIGNMKGAFIRGEFDVTNIVDNPSENILAIHVFPPYNPGIPHEQSIKAGQGLNGGVLSMDGPTFISSISWDWIPGIRDRNTGIWQDVRLKICGSVVIGDPLVTTDVLLPDTSRANIIISTKLKNLSDKNVSGTLYAKVENINIPLPYTLNPNEEKLLTFSPEQFNELKIKNPRLWWPNGYGNPELYDLQLSVTEGEKLSQTKNIRFGIREMSYELMVNDGKKNIRVAYTPNSAKDKGKPVFDYENRVFFSEDNQLPTVKNADISCFERLNDDPVGPYLVIRVNGVRIFCRGGNWGMDDGMKRVSCELLEPYMKLHKGANFNIIRNWTGESTEEVFYELCDKYGMLVWNDFWITTDDTVEPSDFELFMNNATDVVRRFRNHPSIAVWCPRNEGFAPEGLSEKLTEMLAKEDPTRHYHGQSRFLNMGTSGPWGYFKDASLYYTRKAKGFDTEMGSFAIPTANTLRKFIAPEDLWPVNDVWAYHDLHHTSQNFNDFVAAVNRYGKPLSMEAFSQQAQFVCYDAWRAMLEAWNSRMWNTTTGLILWMSHPAWPSMIWQTYTYDYETPGSYFGAKKACEPVHIQMNLPDNEIVVINTTPKDYKSLTASLVYYDSAGKKRYEKNIKTDALANQVTKCFIPDSRNDELYFYIARLELKDERGNILSINDYLRGNGHEEAVANLKNVHPANVKLKLLPTKKEGFYKVEVSAGKTLTLAVKLNVKNKKTGEYLLPAYFSDGYFNLLSGEKRIIDLELPQNLTADYEIIAETYN
jgi:hypothetical protein